MDKDFDDYLTGLNTGVSFNMMSSLGASHSYQPAPPPILTPPVSAPQSPDYGYPAEPAPHWITPVAEQATIKSYNQAFFEKWIWELSDTLVGGFDSLADQLAATSAFRIIAILLAVIACVCAYLQGWGSEPADHWVMPWIISAFFALLAASAPILLILVIRSILWTTGKLVQLCAALTLMAGLVATAGLGGYTIYAIAKAFS